MKLKLSMFIFLYGLATALPTHPTMTTDILNLPIATMVQSHAAVSSNPLSFEHIVTPAASLTASVVQTNLDCDGFDDASFHASYLPRAHEDADRVTHDHCTNGAMGSRARTDADLEHATMVEELHSYPASSDLLVVLPTSSSVKHSTAIEGPSMTSSDHLPSTQPIDEATMVFTTVVIETCHECPASTAIHTTTVTALRVGVQSSIGISGSASTSAVELVPVTLVQLSSLPTSPPKTSPVQPTLAGITAPAARRSESSPIVHAGNSTVAHASTAIQTPFPTPGRSDATSMVKSSVTAVQAKSSHLGFLVLFAVAFLWL